MTDGAAAAWARFERVLPKLGIADVSLAPGASHAAIEAFEKRMNLALPGEVSEFFRAHDGQTSAKAGLAAGFYFVALSEAQKLMEDWAATREHLGDGIKDLDRSCSSRPPKMIQRKYSVAGWVPLLRDNEGNAVGVDLQPATNGSVGQIINFGRDEEEKFVLFPSVTDLLDWLATELDEDRILFDPHDEVIRHVEGRLVAAILETRSQEQRSV